MKTIAVFFACLVLAGCAAQVISSSQRSVIVRADSHDYSGAQKAADEECNKVGRFAKLAMKPTLTQYVYDCVN